MAPLALWGVIWLDRKQRKTKKPPNYRVLLHNDEFNKREYVVQVLLKVMMPPPHTLAMNTRVSW